MRCVHCKLNDMSQTDQAIVVCGACKEGTLIPQFEAKRKPNGSKLSRMASTKPQGMYLAQHRSIYAGSEILRRLPSLNPETSCGYGRRGIRVRFWVGSHCSFNQILGNDISCVVNASSQVCSGLVVYHTTNNSSSFEPIQSMIILYTI